MFTVYQIAPVPAWKPYPDWASVHYQERWFRRDFCEGRLRRHDVCLRLSCATSIRHDFTTDRVRTTQVDVVSENSARVDGRKSWTMLVTHDSRKQKSYRTKSALTERNCAAPILIVERHIWDRFCATLWCSVIRYSDGTGSGYLESRIEPTEKEENIYE